MAIYKHIPLEEFAEFHKVKTTLIYDFADFGLIEIEEIEQKPCLVSKYIDRCESAIRLYRDLEVNKEGIEIILDLREKHEVLQKELMLLKHKIKKHEALMEKMFGT